ncbi:TonB-dependent receptor [Granulicella sibirica]|uniref:TonB-dependent receptor n=1 Tax=Granulicella sibirica TaxID=2479048 RepID=UPI0010093391|nr:TonB-dependent receptor [Granulicella sibirica]
MKRDTTRLLLAFLTLAALAFSLAGPAARAQNTNSGDIRGTATDATGAVIPDVKVTILDIEKGVTKELTTNSAGLYDSGPIVTGTYKVTFTKEGFSQFIRSSVTLNVGTIQIDAAMKTGGVTQEIVVNTDVPLIKTETGEQSTTLVAKEMQNLPNQGQDWQNFVKLIPGATGTSQYGATGQALSVNGNLPYNAVLNDGASSALSHSGNADVSVFETLQEVQISTSAFSAQYGIGGAVFNQISKGGSNQWHGSLYEYAQNDYLNARSYFQKSAPYTRFHNFGGSVSGPVLKDKAFFYFNYDQVINLSASVGFNTVPTAAMRNGDFTGLSPIYDPTTTTQATGTDGKTYLNRTQFANNKITNIDPVAAKAQAYYPAPNVAGTVDPKTGITSNNYYYNIRGSQPFKKYFGRFDYQFSPTNRLTASVTKRDNPAFYPGSLGCPINCYVGDVDSYNSQITDVWNISPTFINELRMGYTNQLNFFATQTAGKGIPAALGLQFSHADIFPTVNISSYQGLSAGTTAVYKEHNFDPSDIVTLIRGNHVLHFGGEYLVFEDNSTAWGNVNGATTGFTGTYSQCTYCVQKGQVASSGNAYADFLLGDIQNWSAGVTPEFAGRQKAPQMFVQDDWKIKSNLTINLGLRYQIMEGWKDAKNNQRTFDPLITNALTNTPGAMWYAANGDHGRHQLQNNVYTTFLPRVGFAYQVRPDLVVRGGYGLYAYLWSLDTYGSGEGSAFGSQGSLSDTTNGLKVLGSLSGTNPQFLYIPAGTTNSAFNGQGVSYNQQNTPVAKIQQYNGTIEKQIGANMAATIAYVGSKSMNLNYNVDINQVPVGKMAVVDQQFRPFTQYNNVTGSTNNATANYNSLQLTFSKRLTNTFSISSSYVWSKFLSEFDSSAWGSRGGTQTYQNAYDPSTNYGPSNFDTRHAFKGNAIFLLPFGSGKMFLNKSKFQDEIVGGWNVSSTYALQTGNPITVTVPSTLGQSYTSGNLYPNIVGSTRGAKTLAQWFNPAYSTATNQVAGAGFSIPTNGTFGNMQRNSIYGPGLENFDLSAGKTFNLWAERYKFQLRVDATNALNHANFSNPGTSLGTGAAGTITSTQNNGRNLQLGGRFSF